MGAGGKCKMPEFREEVRSFDHLEPTYTGYSTRSIQTYDLEDMLKQVAKEQNRWIQRRLSTEIAIFFHVCKYHDEDNL